MRRGASRVACRSVAWLVIVSVLSSSCASRTVKPIGAEKPFLPEADEVRLWTQADEEEEQLQKKTKSYDDPLLEEYLGKIGDKLVSDDVREAGGPGFKFGVLRDPTLNAFAMPNGRIYVHTGLLARLDNEAQLAMIVGHEMTHVTNRHALSFTRDAQNTQIPFTVMAIAASIGVAVAAGSSARSGDDVGAAVLSQTANVLLGLGLQLAAIAAINGYGRDLEREADAGGMANLVRAGYDPKEAPKVFELLRKESKDRGTLETFFFGNHPRLTERVEDTNQLIKSRYAVAAVAPGTVANTEEFGLRMRTVVRENARLDIQAGRFTLAAAQLDRVLALTPKDPVAQLYYGDLYRLQSQRARDVADKADKAKKALERYERSAELDPAFPDPFRQLGFLYYQQKENLRAKEAFQKYLALKPDASDARRIKEYIVEIDR
jgi:predicted Zn-dependent protease